MPEKEFLQLGIQEIYTSIFSDGFTQLKIWQELINDDNFDEVINEMTKFEQLEQFKIKINQINNYLEKKDILKKNNIIF
ncbi:hypothetical protein [Spiroplasma endosymbiont of Notiophilus biguttatus]|uniref:hypothetical protein n=1 Tax=Spiroplasma endosymbiont of Notiophilus biguttatus TaxID=3066285 RepID=UPI00313BBB4E